MSGRRAPSHTADHKLAVMMAQERTPDIGKTSEGAPTRFPLDHDVLSTPSKRSERKKHLMVNNRHLEGSAGKKACLSLDNSCVRRPLIVLLSRLKAEPDNLESYRAHSDQDSAGNSKSRCKTSLPSASMHNMPKISNKKTPVESLKEGTSEKNFDLSSELSCADKNLVVKLVRSREESEKLGGKVSKGTSNNYSDQQNGSGSTSATSTHNSATEKVLRRSLRTKNLQADPLEEETKLSLEADCAANPLSNLNANLQIQEEQESTDESDSEEKSDQEHMGLSAYERERLKNIKENAKFLKSIKLLESVASLHPPKRKSQNRVVKREKPQNTGNTVVRRSMRLQNAAPSEVKLEEQAPIVEQNVRHMKPPGPIEMIPLNQLEDHNTMDQFLKMWASISQETAKTSKNMHVKDLKNYENRLKEMTLRTEDVAKVVPGRTLSVAIHPSESQTLVATGDKYGTVGLWNPDDNSGDGIHTFELHSRHVGCLSFCPWNPAQLISLSYDGTVRCGDVTRSVFEEIYRDEDENFSSFDFLSADGSVLIVSDWDSQLSLVDRRTPGSTYEVRAPVDLSGPRSVNVHPLQRDLCVVAGAGNVCVYDVRQLSNKKLRSVVSLPGHTKMVQSAYFSPVTGNCILTTCADDRLRVFDSSSLGSTVPLLTSIRHNNFTGRWLSRFRAMWDPKQEDCFVIGSMDRPRQIQVFHKDGKLVHVFWDADNLNSVCSTNAIHPTRSIIVGGNSSGRLHVFRD